MSCILQPVNKINPIKKDQYNSSPRLISVVERMLIRRLQEDFIRNEIDITIEQWRMLFYLWNEDGINQQELAQRAKKEKSTITRQISGLEKKGLIERRSSHKDMRNNQIFLTKMGKSIEKKALNIAQLITKNAEKNISHGELKIFRKVLNQMINNLDQDKCI